MDFLDNVVKSSNALIKERLNNPFGKTQTKSDEEQQQSIDYSIDNPAANLTASTSETPNSNPPASTNNKQTSLSSANSQVSGDENKNGDKNSQFAAIAADAEAVAQKAAQGAKNIGTFLFSMANKAGQTVSQTAKQVKQAVESTSILTDFTREQQEFIKEHGGTLQASPLPWEDVDENKAADIREQILSLSQDKRNFVRSPPNDTEFKFEPQQCYPIALSLLKEDPNLNKMRYELVPKLVNEDTFWCNYFYRVFLLKQMSNKGVDIKRHGWASSRSSSGEGPDEITATDDYHNQADEHNPSSTATISATTTATTKQDTSEINTQTQPDLESSESRKLVAEADELKSKLRELNIGSLDGGDQDDKDLWEEEIQRELQEFELISGDVSSSDEAVLDKELLDLERST